MIRAILALSLSLYTIPASAHEKIHCSTIRQHVAEHGKAKAIIWARQQGYSWADILKVRKQCKV